MTNEEKRQCREFDANSAILAGEDEFFQMLDATERYARDGDRPALFRALLTLGIDAEAIRWHADHPGLTVAMY